MNSKNLKIELLWIRIGFNPDPDPALKLNVDLDTDPGSQTNADTDPVRTYHH
jgi:hypothetical protein